VFNRYVFQSRYQHDQLHPQLAKFGYDDAQGRIIRGALDVEEFPFRPLAHAPGETFVVGRLSRAAPEKFSPRTWAIYGSAVAPIAARVMGWDTSVQARVGPPPCWAECLPAGAETAQDFLARLHCLVHASAGAVENWPRVGLEAMAAGVPLVVENKGGWREMICHGRTGFLCNNDEEMVEEIARLTHDPRRRREMVCHARHAVETELADPNILWRQWEELLTGLSGDCCT
jgi:glycosyltransferase involved in cell wall biosynthesis